VTARSVLVVEDDETLGRLLMDVLSAAGHRTRLAQSQAQALAEVEKEPPDVFCLDIDLPDGTGWALLDELDRRQLPVGQVIVATAGMDAGRSRRRPDTYVLPKPFPIDSLLRLVAGEEAPAI
jgi:DNA-binding response OmpR family regulator